jgi:acetyltransferase-like isoleucine patch superfamily enzyme
MKKGRMMEVHYNKKQLVKVALQLLESPKKVMILDYSGKRFNSIYGLAQDIKRVHIPIKYVLKYLVKKFIQIPIFRTIRYTDSELKNRLYRMFGANIGKEVYISPGVYIDEIFPELISIGDGSIIGKDVSILTHEFTIKHVRFGMVNIGKQVLVGANSIVRSGVSIGNKSLIAMDSLVNKDVPEKEEWGGIPAHKIKKLRKLI